MDFFLYYWISLPFMLAIISAVVAGRVERERKDKGKKMNEDAWCAVVAISIMITMVWVFVVPAVLVYLIFKKPWNMLREFSRRIGAA